MNFLHTLAFVTGLLLSSLLLASSETFSSIEKSSPYSVTTLTGERYTFDAKPSDTIAKIKKKLGFSDHKSILISIEGNKLVIELESEDKLSKELEMKKKDLLNFIESINLTPKEEISVEDFLNDSRRY